MIDKITITHIKISVFFIDINIVMCTINMSTISNNNLNMYVML